MLLVKVMTKNTGNDDHPRAAYTLYSGVKDVTFVSPSVDEHTRPYAYFEYPNGSRTSVELNGNVYVMTNEGKTFDTFHIAP